MVTFVWVGETLQELGKGIKSISLFPFGGLLTMRKQRLIFDVLASTGILRKFQPKGNSKTNFMQ